MNRRIAAGLAACCAAAFLLCGCQEKAGWHEDKTGKYYVGTDGSAVIGWQEIDGSTYRFGEDTLMVTGWQDIGGEVYYFHENGIMATGWQKLSGADYFFREDGAMATGWQEINGQTYYFQDEGAAVTGWQEIDGKHCYFRENGSRVTGWLSLDGERYYLTDTGCCVGISEVEGNIYLFDEDGLLTSGPVQMGDQLYYANENGHPVAGWQEIDGQLYFFGEDYAAATGWMEMNGFRYYFHPDGTPAKGEVTIDDKLHRFAFNGQEIVLVNPWNEISEDYTVELTEIRSGHQIADYAVDAYNEMMEACRAAGMDPVVCSSYRTIAYQRQLFQRRYQKYIDNGYSKGEAYRRTGTVVAVPGTSEHHLGLALDIVDDDNWNLDYSQAKMPTQKWLMEHSWEYGWILRYPDDKSEITGIIYEPWHYRYVGREVAADIHATGLCLEEYLQMLTEQ